MDSASGRDGGIGNQPLVRVKKGDLLFWAPLCWESNSQTYVLLTSSANYTLSHLSDVTVVLEVRQSIDR